MVDYYKILELERSATIDEIKKSYRRLAKEYHPDKNEGNKEAEDKFKQLAEAYDVLGNPEKKRKYDATSFGNNQHVYGDWAGMNMNDIMEDLQGTGFAENFDKYFSGSFGKNSARGGDILVELNITLEDVYKGCEKHFSYYERGSDGQTNQSNPISIKIKRGIESGQKLRIKGKGHVSPFNSELPRGDLIVTINVINSILFRREGSTIYYRASVPFYTALLGGDIHIPSIVSGSKLKVKIPEIAKQGQLLKLKNKGLPIYDPNYNWSDSDTFDSIPERFGDMIIEVNIIMPDKITEKERELFNQLKKIKEINDKN